MHWGKNIMACVQIEHSSRPRMYMGKCMYTHACRHIHIHAYLCAYTASTAEVWCP